jgi:hypothetical protein
MARALLAVQSGATPHATPQAGKTPPPRLDADSDSSNGHSSPSKASMQRAKGKGPGLNLQDGRSCGEDEESSDGDVGKKGGVRSALRKVPALPKDGRSSAQDATLSSEEERNSYESDGAKDRANCDRVRFIRRESSGGRRADRSLSSNCTFTNDGSSTDKEEGEFELQEDGSCSDAEKAEGSEGEPSSPEAAVTRLRR